MGNKHDIAPFVADFMRDRDPQEPFVDAFCGMCSVGGAIASAKRTVVCNDVQSFAALVARCLIATPDTCAPAAVLKDALSDSYQYNRRQLVDRFRDELKEEDRILGAETATDYRRGYRTWQHAANNKAIAAELSSISGNERKPYRLATLTFSWGYFGLRQAIAIDSIRYAIDRARTTERLSPAQSNWALVALLQAASCASASPGHFAQYLRPTSDEGFRRILRQRRRNIWTQFMAESAALAPYGTRKWRSGNHVLQADALTIGQQIDSLGLAPGVVYADPPYSKDHYSRYYHVLETLTLYDYPSAEGKGRYRPDRFVTPFSLKTKVEPAMQDFCAAIGERGFTLVLSYPSNGLLNAQCGVDISSLLRKYFKRVDLRIRRPTSHSTLGARHGSAKNDVDELLWVAS
jgi:adenine-specific DNA-methyltransferase